MNRLSPFLKTVFLLVLVFGITPGLQAQIVIDNFAEPAAPAVFPQTTVGTTPFTQAPLNPANTIGGVREGSVTATSIALPGTDIVEVSVGGNIFDYQASAGADGSATLFYDGNAGGAGDLNLNLMGQSIAVTFILSDSSQALPVTVTLDDGSATASVTQTLMTQINSGDPAVTLSFTSAAFTANNPLINLASINSVLFNFDPAEARDFRLGGEGIVVQQQVPIPEPTSLALWGIVAMTGGVCAYRRRKQKAAAA